MGRATVNRARIAPKSRGAVTVAPRSGDIARQRQLPLPWQFVRQPARDKFAHPAEEELAQILTFYRIRWLYEPTSFVLSWGVDGRPAESFTPDFYLPDHHLYIELTTMRQPLVTRKNRKLRRLREIYPGVNIKLLYRRDVERLLGSYDDAWNAPSGSDLGGRVRSTDEIIQRVGQLAGEIIEWRESSPAVTEPLCIIGLGPGALTAKRHLAGALRERGAPVDLDRATITRYRTSSGRKHVRLAKAPRANIAGRDILLVADVISTGMSVAYVVDWMRRNGARRIEICALFNRTSNRLIDMPIRFVGFEAPDQPIVGFGIGPKSPHRGLPFVSTLVDRDRLLESIIPDLRGQTEGEPRV